MSKKEYKKPVSQEVAVDTSVVLAGSSTPQTMSCGTEEDGSAEAKGNWAWDD